MIKSWKHKGLKELFETGVSRKVPEKLRERCRERLTVLNAARDTRALSLPGFEYHPMKGKRVGTHTISVSGPWRITFEFQNGDAYRVDLEQYH